MIWITKLIVIGNKVPTQMIPASLCWIAYPTVVASATTSTVQICTSSVICTR